MPPLAMPPMALPPFAIPTRPANTGDQYLDTMAVVEAPLLPTRPERLLTLLISNLPEGSAELDDVVPQLLTLCGPYHRWRRPQGPNNQTRRLGMCEFVHAESMQRALRILPTLPLGPNAPLVLHMDAACAPYLEAYQAAVTRYVEHVPGAKSPAQMEAELRTQMADLVAAKRWPQSAVHGAPETTQNSLEAPQATVIEEGEVADVEMARHLAEERSRLDFLYEERLRKWEQREAALEKERRREEERLMEQRHRRTRMREALAAFVAAYDLDRLAEAGGGRKLPSQQDVEKRLAIALVPHGAELLERVYRRSAETNHRRS